MSVAKSRRLSAKRLSWQGTMSLPTGITRKWYEMCDQSKTLTVEHIYGAQVEPYKVKLERNTRGFNWEISVAGADLEDVMARIDEANEIMKAKFGGA
jgi:hypothetical protein